MLHVTQYNDETFCGAKASFKESISQQALLSADPKSVVKLVCKECRKVFYEHIVKLGLLTKS
jgi:hypothetical protein